MSILGLLVGFSQYPVLEFDEVPVHRHILLQSVL